MKMAFVINGMLSQNFTTSIGRAQKQIANLNEFSKKLKNSQREQNLIYSTGAMSLNQYERNMARLQRQIDSTNQKIKHFNELMSARNRTRANYNTARIDFLSTMQTVKMASAPLVDAYEAAASFEKAMSKVGAITLGDVKGEEYNRQLQKLTETARRLGETTQFTATQSAEAMSYLGMAGWKTEQILQGMPHLLSLAVAGNTDLARTADILSDNLTAFGLSADKAQHMADVYATVITNTNTNVELLGDTMKYCAPIASAFGATMEETAAMAGVMANSGIKGSMAGTTLRAGLIRLAGPPKMAQKALDELGLSMDDLAAEEKQAAMALKSLGIETGNLTGARKMAVILDNLREKTKGLSKAQKVAMVGAIFGKNAAPGWVKMIDSAPGSFEKLIQSLYNCDGAAATMEKRMNANAKGAAMRMKSAYESLQISLMNGFLPTLANVFDGIAKVTGALSRFASQNPVVAKTIVGIAVAIAGIVSALAAFGMATAAVQYGVAGFKFWYATIKGCTLATKAYTAAQIVAAGVTKMLAFVTGALNAVFAAMPLGWIVLGIAALVVAGTMLYRNWDKVKTFFTNLWDNPTARLLMFVTGPIGWLIGAVTAIIANWDKIKDFFEYLWDNPTAAIFRFTSSIKEMFQGAIDWVKEKWQSFSDFLSKPIFGKINIASSNAAPAARNAAGGIYNKGAFLTTFAEESGESAIPHTPTRRNIGLLAKTNEIMGNPLGGGGINATFAPVINVSGSADAGQISQMMDEKMHEFEAMLKRVADNRRRVSYA